MTRDCYIWFCERQRVFHPLPALPRDRCSQYLATNWDFIASYYQTIKALQNEQD